MLLYLKRTPIKVFVKDFDLRFTCALFGWGYSLSGYFLGTPSVVACKININSIFHRNFSWKRQVYMEGGKKSNAAIIYIIF